MKTLLVSLIFIGFSSLLQTGVSTTGSKVSAADASKALAIHNKARKAVGVPSLQWSEELAKYAQAWANQLAASKCKFEHRPYSGKWKQLYGENIFWGSSSSYSVEDACNSWLEEKKDFKNSAIASATWAKTGHYSQMIWRNTTKVGLGIAVCKGGDVIVVANYDPPGNYMGQKAY